MFVHCFLMLKPWTSDLYPYVSSGPSPGSTGWQRWFGQGGWEAWTRGRIWNQLPLGELQQGVWHTRPASSRKRYINWWILRNEEEKNRKFISLFICLSNSTSTMSTSMEKRRSLCVTGRSALENRGLSKPSTCWWFICADTQERSHTSAPWAGYMFVSVYVHSLFLSLLLFVSSSLLHVQALNWQKHESCWLHCHILHLSSSVIMRCCSRKLLIKTAVKYSATSVMMSWCLTGHLWLDMVLADI